MFHELARHLQTRRLIAGDSLSLNQDKSFYCVVEGMVQVYAQTGHSPEVQQSLWDDEVMNGYQLLNEVGSGGTLSSLFTILSLFTEDVQMSWQDEYPGVSVDDTACFESSPSALIRNRANSDVSQFDLESKTKTSTRRFSVSSTTSTVHADHSRLSRGNSMSPGHHDGPPVEQMHPFIPSRPPRPTPAHRGVVARATVDTTLAVIPAEAFRRLTKKFPKATGHIVQGYLLYPFLRQCQVLTHSLQSS